MATCFMAILFCMVVRKSQDLQLEDEKVHYYSLFASALMLCVFITSYMDHMQNYETYDTADLRTYSLHSDEGCAVDEYLLDESEKTVDGFDYELRTENAAAQIVSESGIKLELAVTAESEATVEIPRFNYLHFKAFDSDGNVFKTTTGTNNRMLLHFDQPYNGTVYIDFVEPWYWRFAEIVSAIGIIVVVTAILLNRLKNKTE